MKGPNAECIAGSNRKYFRKIRTLEVKTINAGNFPFSSHATNGNVGRCAGEGIPDENHHKSRNHYRCSPVASEFLKV
jgi:hypothetical protein